MGGVGGWLLYGFLRLRSFLMRLPTPDGGRSARDTGRCLRPRACGGGPLKQRVSERIGVNNVRSGGFFTPPYRRMIAVRYVLFLNGRRVYRPHPSSQNRHPSSQNRRNLVFF